MDMAMSQDRWNLVSAAELLAAPGARGTWFRIHRANHMAAIVVADCDITSCDSGERLFGYGDILLPRDLDRILAPELVILDNDDSDHRREWERGSSDVLAALCNLVLLIALVVFLLCVAPRLNLRFDLGWLSEWIQ